MDYDTLLDLTADLGYRLAMAGAETFRIEESVTRILAAYGLNSEVFAIPNCLIVSIETAEGRPMTRMRRIGSHGNDLDTVERYNNLSRRICQVRPAPRDAANWLMQAEASRVHYRLPVFLLGNALAAWGFSLFFGGTFADSLCAALCGAIIGLVGHWMDNLSINPFFRTICAAFLVAFIAYAAGVLNLADNTDTVVIGALMILVPGLLFTNAMRDIIFGDTNSGIVRIVQVFLIAAALALGTGTAWRLADTLWQIPTNPAPLSYPFVLQAVACFAGCLGCSIFFNIHGWGMILCVLGGVLSWGVFTAAAHWSGNSILAYFYAAMFCSAYAEVMARVRKYPAITYLVVSLFPLLPGAGIYFTTQHFARGNLAAFAAQGRDTVAIAAVLAVSILLVSTIVRSLSVWHHRKKQ